MGTSSPFPCIWTFEDCLFFFLHYTPWDQNCVKMPQLSTRLQGQFFVRGKISNCDFLLFNQALKIKTFPTFSSEPFTWGTDDGQMPVGC